MLVTKTEFIPLCEKFIHQHLEDYLNFFHPHVQREINWHKGCQWLTDEIKLLQNPYRLNQLFSVTTTYEETRWLWVH